MSETDGFIEEVAEEVRRDRLFGLFRKYGWIPALLIIVIVGGAAYNEYRKANAESAAQRLGDSILTAMSLGDVEARVGALAELSTDGDAAGVVTLIQSGANVQADKITEADEALRQLAENASVPAVYRDLANLKRLYLRGNGLEGDERSAIIDSLATPGGAFRTLAEEQRALMLAEQGENESAVSIFSDLVNDSESPPQLISRARQMIIVLGGSLSNG